MTTSQCLGGTGESGPLLPLGVSISAPWKMTEPCSHLSLTAGPHYPSRHTPSTTQLAQGLLGVISAASPFCKSLHEDF